MKFISKQKAYTSLCGPNCRLSLLGTLQVVQDVICEYFETMGAGQIKIKEKYNCVWVFLKNKFHFCGDILWNEEYSAECFISFRSNVKLIVDTNFFDKSGALAMNAKTEICLMDLSAIRITKIDDSVLGKQYTALLASSDMNFEKLLDSGEVFVGSKKVQASNIDFCGHCNNIEYVRFLLDAYSAGKLNSMSIDTFEICYYNQSLEGDVLEIYKTSSPSVDFFEVKNKDSLCLKCKIVKK